MNNILKLSIVSGFLFLLNSCAVIPLENLKKVTVGMNKPTLLDIAGDPDKTFRQDGKEYWTYKYYGEDESLKEGQVIIENSVVTYVYLHKMTDQRQVQPANTQAQEPAAAAAAQPLPKTYKDYKDKVKQKRKSYDLQFKNLGD